MRHRSVILGFLAISLGACAGTADGERDAYFRAIYQSAVYSPDNIRPLKPLGYPIQAVSLTGYPDWAQGREGQQVELGRETWITVEPQLREACRTWRGPGLMAALHRYLGLKPATAEDAAKKRLVLMTIDGPQANGPAGIGVFRPCANPDPKAASCDAKAVGPEAYQQWYANLTVASYKVAPDLADAGYPWTRLGYTYNWTVGEGPEGAQEYVAPKGTTVTVRGVVRAEDYCE